MSNDDDNYIDPTKRNIILKGELEPTVEEPSEWTTVKPEKLTFDFLIQLVQKPFDEKWVLVNIENIFIISSNYAISVPRIK